LLLKGYKDRYPFEFDGTAHDAEGGERLCEDYYWRRKYAEGLSRLVQYSIIVLNTVIRMIVIASINWVGCDDESNQMRHITNVVFLCQWFNTGWLLMLCNANMDGQGGPLARLFAGYGTDFNT